MPTKPKLVFADYQKAALKLSVDIPTIRAVTQVESGGAGFGADGKCIIRFEPHIFSRKTKQAFDASHPTLSFPTWKPGYPTGVAHSWRLFGEGAALNPGAAVQSTSWGLFQIMGFHYTSCDCESLSEFVKRMETSEAEQLDLFCSFIINTGLADELQRHDWTAFARMYNGVGYRVNKYDTKLAQAYAKFSLSV